MGIDTISDFTVAQDKIQLSKLAFSALSTTVSVGSSPLLMNDFTIVTSDTAAAIATSAIVYNSSNGKLFYNADLNANGFGSNGGQFAQITTGLALTSNDFSAIS